MFLLRLLAGERFGQHLAPGIPRSTPNVNTAFARRLRSPVWTHGSGWGQSARA